MPLPDFLILAIATWRLSYMLVSEPGPGNLLTKLRTLPNGGVFDCLFCTSFWVGLLGYWLYTVDFMPLVYPFAISGLAMMLRSYTGVGLGGI